MSNNILNRTPTKFSEGENRMLYKRFLQLHNRRSISSSNIMQVNRIADSFIQCSNVINVDLENISVISAEVDRN